MMFNTWNSLKLHYVLFKKWVRSRQATRDIAQNCRSVQTHFLNESAFRNTIYHCINWSVRERKLEISLRRLSVLSYGLHNASINIDIKLNTSV